MWFCESLFSNFSVTCPPFSFCAELCPISPVEAPPLALLHFLGVTMWSSASCSCCLAFPAGRLHPLGTVSWNKALKLLWPGTKLLIPHWARMMTGLTVTEKSSPLYRHPHCRHGEDVGLNGKSGASGSEQRKEGIPLPCMGLLSIVSLARVKHGLNL